MQRPMCKAIASPLRTTVYDRVNSFLCSAIGVCGFVVCVLLAVWLLGPQQTTLGTGVTIHDTKWPDRDDNTNQELVVEDFEKDEILQRKFEDVIQSIPAVTDRLSQVIAGGSIGDDPRNVSPPGEPGPNPIPGSAVRNWEIRYEADSLEQYAKQLDHFGIELGAVSLDDNRIVRVSRLSGTRQKFESSRIEEEESVYFAHKQRRLKRWDRKMARSVDLDFEFDVVHLFPKQATAQMRQAELDYLNDQARDFAEIENTLFELVPDGDGWKIRVAVMEFTEREEGQ